MNTYPKEYFGQLVTVVGRVDKSDLIKVGDKLVCVEKQKVRVKKWPKLRSV